jgi:hypothetical protein
MKKVTKITTFLFSLALVLGMVTINSCKDDESLPQINGYDNSDQVAATYLKAHWTFDDTYNEAISSTAPSNKYGGYAFSTGQIGKALNLTAGTLVYPSIANIGAANSLPNFSVSLWVNVKDTKGGTGAFTSFFGIIPTNVADIWGNVMALAETARHPATSDTLELKSYLNTTLPDASQSGQDNVAQHNNETGNGLWFKGANKWSHFVMTWDGATHKFLLYGDAVSCGAWNDRGTTPALVMRTPCQAVFGSLAASDIGFANAGARGGWYPMATAMIDDVRVYNTVLSQADITALFNLGSAGR